MTLYHTWPGQSPPRSRRNCGGRAGRKRRSAACPSLDCLLSLEKEETRRFPGALFVYPRPRSNTYPRSLSDSLNPAIPYLWMSPSVLWRRAPPRPAPPRSMPARSPGLGRQAGHLRPRIDGRQAVSDQRVAADRVGRSTNCCDLRGLDIAGREVFGGLGGSVEGEC